MRNCLSSMLSVLIIVLTFFVSDCIQWSQESEESVWPERHSSEHGLSSFEAGDIRTPDHFVLDDFRNNRDTHTKNLVERSTSEDYLYIEIRNPFHSKDLPPQIYTINSTYMYKIGDAMELSCKSKISNETSLHWIDQNGFSTATHHSEEIRLEITPDRNDDDLTLMCVSYVHNKSKTISIKPKTNSVGDSSVIIVPKNYKKGSPIITSPTCNAVVYFPDVVDPIIVFSNKTVIEKFEERYENTVMYCHNYEHGEDQIPTYHRRKSTSTLHLESETMTTESKLKKNDLRNIVKTGDTMTNKYDDQKTLQATSNSGTNTTLFVRSETDTIAIVAGTLGSIILLLLVILIFMWHRRMQRRRLINGSEHNVVYAEIEERFQHPPPLPPPRNDPPYAKIVGTLVPTPSSQEKTHDTAAV